MADGLTLAFYVAWVVSDLSNNWEWLKNVTISPHLSRNAHARAATSSLHTWQQW